MFALFRLVRLRDGCRKAKELVILLSLQYRSLKVEARLI